MDKTFVHLMEKHGREMRRALANHRYEIDDAGDLLIPDMKLRVGGRFSHSVNDGAWITDPNRVVNEGLNHLLDVTLADGTKTATWYVALFSGNVVPPATWTGANFVGNSTEYVNYVGITRPEYQEGAVAAQTVSNTNNSAEFVANNGGGTVWGAAILSNPAKSAVTGRLFAAARFATSRTLVDTDILRVSYEVSASST